MKDSTKQQIDQLLNSFEATRQQQRETQETTASAEKTFLDSFSKLAEARIIPELTELGEHLKARGYEYQISQHPEYYQHQAHVKQIVTFRLAVDASLSSTAEDVPRLRYTCDVRTKKVSVDYSTVTKARGGSGGSLGQYTLEEISRESVESDATAFLSKLLSTQ